MRIIIGVWEIRRKPLHNEFKVSREDQDEFAYHSHMKALKAQAENRFQDQIVPIEVEETSM